MNRKEHYKLKATPRNVQTKKQKKISYWVINHNMSTKTE